MNNYEKKPLSANSWIAAVILTVCTFGAYYFFVFPQLASQNEEMFYRQVKIADETPPFQIEANIPKYLSDFQDSKLTINIACEETKNGEAQDCAGLFNLVSFLAEDEREVGDSHVTLRRLDIKDQPAVVRNLYIKYDLKAYEIMSVPVSVQISSRNGEYVVFSIYENPPRGLAVVWDDNTNCKASDNTWLCARIDSGKAIQQSGVENLLLPPWSNRLIPFIVFAMVWLAEQIMPTRKQWNEQPNAWMLLLAVIAAFFLFLFYAILDFALLKGNPVIALLFALLLVLSIITLPKIFSSLWSDE